MREYLVIGNIFIGMSIVTTDFFSKLMLLALGCIWLFAYYGFRKLDDELEDLKFKRRITEIFIELQERKWLELKCPMKEKIRR